MCRVCPSYTPSPVSPGLRISGYTVSYRGFCHVLGPCWNRSSPRLPWVACGTWGGGAGGAGLIALLSSGRRPCLEVQKPSSLQDLRSSIALSLYRGHIICFLHTLWLGSLYLSHIIAPQTVDIDILTHLAFKSMVSLKSLGRAEHSVL